MSANKKGKAMTSEQIPMSAREILTKGWELKQQSMALGGMPVPDFVKFQIDGSNHIRATRVGCPRYISTRSKQ